MIKSISQIALQDICQYAIAEREKRRSNQFEHEADLIDESWIVSRNYLETKKTSHLNRLLGIHKINKTNNGDNFRK